MEQPCLTLQIVFIEFFLIFFAFVKRIQIDEKAIRFDNQHES
jgi:hypothetical protein